MLLSAQVPDASVIPKMALPDGAESWVIEVFTGGGITGKFDREFAISSGGRILCDFVEPKCPGRFSSAPLQQFLKIVPVSGEFVPPAMPMSMLCSDCLTKTMTVRRRDATGMEQTYTVSWNLLTASAVPADIRRLYEAVIAIRNP